MRLLKFTIEGIRNYSKNHVSMDLYASDRVSMQSTSVHRFDGAGKNICSQRRV